MSANKFTDWTNQGAITREELAALLNNVQLTIPQVATTTTQIATWDATGNPVWMDYSYTAVQAAPKPPRIRDSEWDIFDDE